MKSENQKKYDNIYDKINYDVIKIRVKKSNNSIQNLENVYKKFGYKNRSEAIKKTIAEKFNIVFE